MAARIEATIAELDTLNRRASTPERLQLLGSASKRLAWVSADNKARSSALLRMARYYRKALDMKGGDDVYALSNWALALLLLERADPAYGGGSWHAELARLIQRQSDRTRARDEADPDFFNIAGLADLQVLRLLLAADDAAAVVELSDSAAAGYAAALSRGASLRVAGSVREHLDFLIDLLATPATERSDRSQAATGWPPRVRVAVIALRGRI